MFKLPFRKRPPITTDDRWVDPMDYTFCTVWFTYLRISPSYELARKHRNGTLTDADTARLPADFDAVLAVYDDLGDVQQVQFLPWWKKTGIRYLGNEGIRLSLGPITVLNTNQPDPLSVVSYFANEYIDKKWTKQGRPTTAIISVPLGLTKTEIRAQLDFLLTKYDDELKVAPPRSAKYSIESGKKDADSLFKYQKCVVCRACIPEMPLHEIGAISEISSTYSGRVLDGSATADDKERLRILTSRAILQGLMLAENAARGIFPSHSNNEHAVSPNWDELGDLLNSAEEIGELK